MANPDRDGTILVGRSTSDEFLALAVADRHGLATGAIGTGKTVTLQALAEGFSRAGVPVFAADIKGDLSGIAARGEARPEFIKRAKDVGFDYQPEEFPVGVATQVAAEFTKAGGNKTAGNIGKAVVRGALGGVLRR